MSERKRRFWPILTAALIGVPMLYLLSVVPLVWLLDQPHVPHALQVAAYFYTLPLLWSRDNGPEFWKSLVQSYLDLWFA